MKRFFWVGTIIGSVIGALSLFGSLLDNSAPRQAAGAAIAVALAVIPYCIARAVDGLMDSPTTELRKLNDQFAAQARALAYTATCAPNGRPGDEPEAELDVEAVFQRMKRAQLRRSGR